MILPRICYNQGMNKEDLITRFHNTSVDIEGVLKAQDIARACLEHMREYLRPGLGREEIHEECARYMTALGSQRWWIHDDPALILFGDMTAYSGREDPAPRFRGKTVQPNDLITIDVAPTVHNGWGDLARSFVMEDGKIVNWKNCRNEEIRQRMAMEMRLHQLFVDSVDERMTFEMLHDLVDSFLKKAGYRNLDYHGNYGHTIENEQRDRVTIDRGVRTNIVSYGKPITFEPHICRIDGSFGIKHEIMYVYYEGKMRAI